MTTLSNKIKQVIDQSSEFFNTTNLTGDELKQAYKKAISQDKIIYNLLLKHKQLSASQVFLLYPESKKNTPITSIRRSLTNLKNAGLVIKTNIKRTGLYGRSEYIYKITPTQ